MERGWFSKRVWYTSAWTRPCRNVLTVSKCVSTLRLLSSFQCSRMPGRECEMSARETPSPAAPSSATPCIRQPDNVPILGIAKHLPYEKDSTRSHNKVFPPTYLTFHSFPALTASTRSTTVRYLLHQQSVFHSITFTQPIVSVNKDAFQQDRRRSWLRCRRQGHR